MAQIVYAESARAVAAEPRDVFTYLLNAENYLEVDRKIKKIYKCAPTGSDDYELALRANLRGMPGPRITVLVHSERWKSISFRQTGGRFAASLFHISGEILADELEEGTLLTRRYELETKGILAIPSRWWLAGWLQRNVELELDLLARRFNPEVIELRKRNVG